MPQTHPSNPEPWCWSRQELHRSGEASWITHLGWVQSGVSWSLLVAQGFPRRPRKRNYICTQACFTFGICVQVPQSEYIWTKDACWFLAGIYRTQTFLNAVCSCICWNACRTTYWVCLYRACKASDYASQALRGYCWSGGRRGVGREDCWRRLLRQLQVREGGHRGGGGGASPSEESCLDGIEGAAYGTFQFIITPGVRPGDVPHIFVRRSCFWFCTPPPRPPPPPPPPPPPSLTHNLCHAPSPTHTQLRIHLSYTSFTHNFTYIFVTHVFVSHHLSHTSLSHTIFDTQSFTHIFVTHHLSHTSLSHTIFHTHLCHHTHLRQPPSPSPTYIFVTHIFVNHHLSHTIFVTHHVTGVALGHIHLRFTWQAWHLWHWAGSGGALGWLATSFPGSQAPSSQIRGHARKRNWVVKMAGIGPAGTAIVARSQVLSTELMGMVSFWNYRFYGQVSAVFDPHPSSKHWFAEDRPRKADQLGQLGW